MDRTRYEQATDDFSIHFKHVTAGALTDVQQGLVFEELQLLVDVLPAGDRLVVTHLGLDGNAMVYGLSFVKGRPSGGGLDFDMPDTPTHYLNGGDLRSIPAAEWQPYHQSYRQHIRLDRGDGKGPGPLTNDDARAVVLPWDGAIEEMYRLTVQGANGPFRMVLSSVCTEHDGSDGGPAGFRHGAAFHAQERRLSGWSPMLDDIDHYISMYRYKAADYGHSCPPSCSRFLR